VGDGDAVDGFGHGGAGGRENRGKIMGKGANFQPNRRFNIPAGRRFGFVIEDIGVNPAEVAMTMPVPSVFSRRIVETPSSAPVRLADVAMALREQGRTVYDFSAGRASEATPEHICAAAKRALDEGDTHQTMAQGTTAYRRACARKLVRDNGVEADPDRNIIATMGTKQGLMLALMALLDPGDEVIVEDPCFVSYQPEIRFCGGKAVEVPLRAENRFRWTYADLAAAVTPRTKAILCCNPHNPTGVVLTEGELDVIARVAQERGIYVIVGRRFMSAVPWGGRRHVSSGESAGNGGSYGHPHGDDQGLRDGRLAHWL